MQQHARQKLGIAGMLEFLARRRARALLALGVDIHRRDSHLLAGLYTRVGLHPAAIDADLAGTEQLLQRAEAEPRIMDLEPPVEPHTGLVLAHVPMFNASHSCSSFNLRPL